MKLMRIEKFCKKSNFKFCKYNPKNKISAKNVLSKTIGNILAYEINSFQQSFSRQHFHKNFWLN